MFNFNKQCISVINGIAERLTSISDEQLSGLNVSDAYACMYSDDAHIITVISRGDSSSVTILMFKDSQDYSSVRSYLKENNSSTRFSPQNSKLIDYSRQISAKLRSGIDIAIVDAQSDDTTVECPYCGAKNERNPAMPYCMECGESLD